MKFTREIHGLLIGVLAAFAIVSISAAYWAIIGPDTILRRGDNPRLVEAEASIVRGDIVDRQGELLATSIRNPDRSITRQYLHPETSSALGYFSLRYGVGGAEAAYDAILRGDDLDLGLGAYLSRDLLHKPQVGSKIRLTFDLDVQREVYRALNGHIGAAVVMSVPDGAMLALVSLPTYNPNTLDADWETLNAAAGKPFFNRALQGNYQPGGMLQTPLMAAALLARQPIDTVFEDAARQVSVADVTLHCAVQPPSSALTLSEAFAFACPYPFSQLIDQLGPQAIASILDSFNLNRPPTLDGFTAAPLAEATPEVAATSPSDDDFRARALGQGSLTATPLGMAMIAASILNEGNAPQPFTLLDIQRPDESAWTPSASFRPSIPMTTSQVAVQLQELLRNAVRAGAARKAARPNLDIGGHAALAYSGQGSQAWFMGFAKLADRQGVVVAVVVEDSDDPALAAEIGGTTLAAGSAAVRGD